MGLNSFSNENIMLDVMQTEISIQLVWMCTNVLFYKGKKLEKNETNKTNFDEQYSVLHRLQFLLTTVSTQSKVMGINTLAMQTE